jgi:hypothetical protein
MTTSTIEFHIPANPTPSFFSQIGMFALSLRELGPPYSVAPIHVSLGHRERVPIPDAYGLAQCRAQLRWHWVIEKFAKDSYFAQGENRFRVIGDSELVCMCDADTLLVRRIDELLQELKAKPAVAGVVVHSPQFSRTKERTVRQGWEYAAQMLLGRSIEFPCHCTLQKSEDGGDNQTPFCPNFGFVIGSRELMRNLRHDLCDFRKKIINLFPALPDAKVPPMHFYSAQIALALAIEKNRTPWRELPMRYNWPNDTAADALYPGEVSQIRVVHYLRRGQFQRERIFCDRESFAQFMQARLSDFGSQLLQERVRKLTGGIFFGPQL